MKDRLNATKLMQHPSAAHDIIPWYTLGILTAWLYSFMLFELLLFVALTDKLSLGFIARNNPFPLSSYIWNPQYWSEHSSIHWIKRNQKEKVNSDKKNHNIPLREGLEESPALFYC